MSKKNKPQSLREVAEAISGGPHKHAWERGMPILKTSEGHMAPLGKSGVPWEGPFECICGQSRWLHGGFVGHDLRTMDGLLNRMHELKAKLDAGEELDEQDTKDIELIAKAMGDAINAFIEALRPVMEAAAQFLADFWANLPQPLKDMLIAYRDLDLNIEPVQSVTIVDSAGVPLYEVPITPDPKPATEIRADNEQVYPELTMEVEPEWEAEGTFEVAEPEAIQPDPASLHMTLPPGHAIVGGKVISLDEVSTTRLSMAPGANDAIQQIARQAWPNLEGR